MFDVLRNCASLRQRPLLGPHVLLGSGYDCQCLLSFSALVVFQALQVELIVNLVGLVAEIDLVVRAVRGLLVLELLFVFDIVEDPERSSFAWFVRKHLSLAVLRVVLC